MKKLSKMINKVEDNYRQLGFTRFLQVSFKLVYMWCGNMFYLPWNKKKLSSLVQGKSVIVISKTIEWTYAFQRTQQLATEFAKRSDLVVIYVTKPTKFDFFCNMKVLNKSLICFSFKHYEKLNDSLSKANEVILYLTNLNEMDTNLKLKHDKMVYEYIDELSIFFEDLELAQKLHNRALELADLTVATALRLYEEVKDKCKNVILSENAGDYDFFKGTMEVKANQKIVDIASQYETVYGYYGMLADWFDYNLVMQHASRNKNEAWILIGPKYSGFNLENTGITKIDNIYIIDAIPYKELPSYVKPIDILTIPFVLNEITASTSPVKLFEYMAIGKPIITSKLIECTRYSSVKIYDSLNSFEKISLDLKHMDEREKKDYSEQLHNDAINNTWSKRVDQIMESLNSKRRSL